MLLVLAALLLPACHEPGPTQRTVQTRTLTAVLYAYVPDAANDQFAKLVQILASRFKEQNPEIDLRITMNPDLDLYDFQTLSTLLGEGDGAVNVVELDTILLGDLVKKGLVQAVGVSPPDILNTAWASATVNSTVYGVPTYLCGNVIYARSQMLGKNAATGPGLLKFLQGLNSQATPLVGNYKGSWTLPSAYVDAWADDNTNNPAEVAGAYNLPLNDPTMGTFEPLVFSCQAGGLNRCLDGTYKDNTGAETAFATGGANGFVGYSERLFFILGANPDQPNLSVASAPLDDGNRPVMFVDALVFNPACTGQCLQDAQSFATFMNTLEVRNLIAFSQDAPSGTFPRYLLQANQSFYSSEPAASNVIYQELWANHVSLAEPYPNQDFPEARVALNVALLARLKVDAAALEEGGRRAAEHPFAPSRFPERFRGREREAAPE